MLPARKRALVLGGGADEGEGGLLSARGCLCNLPDFTVPRTRMGPCVRCGCFGQLGEIASIKIFTLHLGLSLIPPGQCCILIITIRVAMRCLLIPLVVFLGCIRLDGEPVPARSRPVSDGNLLSRCARAMLELWFSKPARTRADAHPQTKNALHQQARAAGQLDTACLELQPSGITHFCLFSLPSSLRHGAVR